MLGARTAMSLQATGGCVLGLQRTACVSERNANSFLRACRALSARCEPCSRLSTLVAAGYGNSARSWTHAAASTSDGVAPREGRVVTTKRQRAKKGAASPASSLWLPQETLPTADPKVELQPPCPSPEEEILLQKRCGEPRKLRWHSVARHDRHWAVVVPARSVGELLPRLKPWLLEGGRIQRNATEDSLRMLLLSPAAAPPSALRDALPAALLAAVSATAECKLILYDHEVPYSALTAEEALRLLLPPGAPVPSSFEEAGAVVHLNLRDEARPWRHVAGAVLLDKLGPRVRTVVNKRGELRGPFRTFDAELLAGEPSLEATVSENGVRFAVDVGRCYWNSRLGPERARLVAQWGSGDVVLDLCCGVGPIVVAAARRGVAQAFANDLNPTAAQYCLQNAAAAGVADRVRVFCGDGALVAKRVMTSPLLKLPVTQVVANLPQGAPELMGAALRGVFQGGVPGAHSLPRCHVYAFSRAADPAADILARCAAALGVSAESLQNDAATGSSIVRTVAPGKEMVRVSFQLPEEAALGPPLA